MSSKSAVAAVSVFCGALLGSFGTARYLQRPPKTATKATEKPHNAFSDPNIVFVLDDKAITRSDLPAASRTDFFQIQSQTYETELNFLKTLALRAALAHDKGIEISQMPPLNDLLNVTNVTDADAKDFFEKNRTAFPPSTTFETQKQQIRQLLQLRRVSEARQAAMDELEKKNRIKIYLAPPIPPEIHLDTTGFPVLGPPQLPLRLVEVSAYVDPISQSLKPEVDAILKANKETLRFVQINFSKYSDDANGVLVRGGYCAAKLGDEPFWRYNDKGFQYSSLHIEEFSSDHDALALAAARDANLPMDTFSSCLKSEDAMRFVADTYARMGAIGVRTTPVFFLNDKRIDVKSGADLRTAIQAARSKSPAK